MRIENRIINGQKVKVKVYGIGDKGNIKEYDDSYDRQISAGKQKLKKGCKRYNLIDEEIESLSRIMEDVFAYKAEN